VYLFVSFYNWQKENEDNNGGQTNCLVLGDSAFSFSLPFIYTLFRLSSILSEMVFLGRVYKIHYLQTRMQCADLQLIWHQQV
jgi:hypothetical protein